jgi:hypothetical protein
MESRQSQEPALVFERPVLRADTWSVRGRVERSMLWTAIAAVVGCAPAVALYVLRFGSSASVGAWSRLVIQALSFVLATGLGCGLAIALGSLLSSPQHLARWRRLLGGALGGAAAGAVAGSFGATHFGSMTTPYFGGGAILASVALALSLAGTGFARAECPLGSWPRSVAAGLLPALPIAMALAAAAHYAPQIVALELGAMQTLAVHLGLQLLGAIGGALLGALGGCWLSASGVLAHRFCGATGR